MKNQKLDMESLDFVSGGMSSDEHSEALKAYHEYFEELRKKYGGEIFMDVYDRATPQEAAKLWGLYERAYWN